MNGEGMRQAAVLLASLHPSDRRWIRRRLPDGWSARLMRLCRQVQNVAPTDAGVLREVLDGLQDTRPEPPPPDVLLAGLEGLLPAWVARTLVACAPDHRELYLSGRSQPDRVAVERALRDGPASLPPKLAETLARVVRQRGERALATEIHP